MNAPLNATSYGLSTLNSDAANAVALSSWWSALTNSAIGISGYIPAGTYNVSGNNVWDFSGSRSGSGITIYGDGAWQSVLNFTNSTGTSLITQCSGGTSPSSLVGYYYNTLRDIGFTANTTGVAFKIGQDNGADSIQGSTFQNLIFSNANSSATASLRINGATQNNFINIQATAYPATVSNVGAGDALQLVMAAFNNFIGCAFGDANRGVYITDLGNTGVLGFCYDNLFTNVDMENVQWGVYNESPAASRNKFVLGTMFTPHSGGFGAYSTASGLGGAGSTIMIDNYNLQIAPLYPTSSTKALDASNYLHRIGVIFTGGGYGAVITPPFPSPSGAIYMNNTGQTQIVNMGNTGTISSIDLNGDVIPASTNSFILMPDDQIAFGYSGAPSWYFRNFVN